MKRELAVGKSSASRSSFGRAKTHEAPPHDIMVRSFLALRAATGAARAKIARPSTYQELLRRASECVLGGAPVGKMTDQDGDEIHEEDYASIIEDGDVLFFTAAPPAPPAPLPAPRAPPAPPIAAAAPAHAPSGGGGSEEPATRQPQPQQGTPRRKRFQRPFNKINPPTKRRARSLSGPSDCNQDDREADGASAPAWWKKGMDERFAEVLYLTDRDTVPVPNYYNDRLAFGSIECEVRFPGISKAQMLTEAAHYIDEQIEPGGAIIAHWRKLKAGAAVVMPPSVPTPKRRPNLRANGKVWVEIHTSQDGTLISS